MFLFLLLKLEIKIINITVIVNKTIYMKRKETIQNFYDNILPRKYSEELIFIWDIKLLYKFSYKEEYDYNLRN